MKRLFGLVVPVLLLCLSSSSSAEWKCDDWVSRRGYCVDYVKSRVPSFPVPTSDADITRLDNKNVGDVAKGDVAIFDLGRYWHVAYVENVHRDHVGTVMSIDVSEKNYGDPLTRLDFTNLWDSSHVSAWKRAVWCGVTTKFGQTSVRSNVPIESVEQIWSPKPSLFHRVKRGKVGQLLDNAQVALKHIFRFSRNGL